MRSPVIATKSVHPVYDVRQCGDFHWKWHSHARASVANRIKTAPTGVGQQLRGQGSTENLLIRSASQFLLAQLHQQVSHGIVRNFINGYLPSVLDQHFL